MPPHSQQTWLQAERLLGAGQLDAARAAYEALLATPAWVLPAHLRLAAVAAGQGRLRDSVAHALQAWQARTDDPVLLEAVCRQLVDNGELQAAVDCAIAPALLQAEAPEVLAGVGRMMDDQSFPDLAAPLFRRARALGLDDAGLRYRIGKVATYAGHADVAERELQGCLQLDPDFAPAWRDLARLRRQTPANNHVDDLRAAIARAGQSRNAPLLHYALFKELDDLGDTAAAWQALAEGMRLRRGQVRFDPAAEQALFEHLMTLQGPGGDAATPATATPATATLAKSAPAEPAKAAPADEAQSGPVPIFIVGMPRSGTTLLERILGAHPQVADAGELRDFNFQLRWMCDRVGPPHLDLDLAQRADGIDWAELGRRYLAHTRWHARDRAYYTDKLPANFVHVGHIARALPQARILHMVRAPMDTCFSNLKELFGEAYPHSYDQVEMADHFVRYRRLMAHWHAQFPGRVLDVDYAALVADPEQVARGVLDFCGLPWDQGVAASETRAGTVATASATQVREPIHQRFIGQWRRYETHLHPLQERLASANLPEPPPHPQ